MSPRTPPKRLPHLATTKRHPPPRARHAAGSTTSQKTAVYPRIIPRTGQFGTVSELKPSHTLHASLWEAYGKMRLFQGYSAGMLVHDCECFQMTWLRDLAEESECSGSQPAVARRHYRRR